jgi:predicted HicB family RNase H-like nuclease
MPTKKRKAGRPALPKGEVKGKITPVRLQDQEWIVYEKAARKANLSLSEWIRQSLRTTVENLQ